VPGSTRVSAGFRKTDEAKSELALDVQLDQLLNEELRSVLRRERCTFDELTAPFCSSLVLFGAGALDRKTLAGLRRVGIEPLAFTDNDPAKWNTTVDGVTVLSPPETAHKFGQNAAFVVTIWGGQGTERMRDRVRQLCDLNCACVVSFGSLFWKVANVFLPHYALDLPHKVVEQADEVRRAFSVWSDEASRREYLAQLRWRLMLDFDGLPASSGHELYFPTDLFALSPAEVFVDCGAYDGDTLRRFFHHQGGRFGRVIAFEPDPASFRKLRDYASALPEEIRARTKLHQLAVGARRETLRFTALGTQASAVGTGTLEVDSVALDDVMRDCVPTYIKMDTEGSEPDALRGSRQLIERDTPALAVSLEHRQDDLWRIPLLVRSFSDQYHFFLRPHRLEIWDLTFYAVPAGRLSGRGRT